MHEISRLHKGEMAAVKGIDVLRLRELIDHAGLLVDISCDNSPKQQVIGGAIAPLRDFSRLLLENGLEPVKLGVSGAWHTRLMTEGVALMRDYLAGVDVTPPRHAVVMNVSGKAEYHPEQIKENLARHLTHTVKWRDSIDGCLFISRTCSLSRSAIKPTLLRCSLTLSGLRPRCPGTAKRFYQREGAIVIPDYLTFIRHQDKKNPFAALRHYLFAAGAILEKRGV